MWFQIYFFLLFVIQYCLSVSDPVFIKKTKIEYDKDIKCKDNPFLFLLPENMRHTIKITLSNKPGKKNLSYCKNSNIKKTCCTSFTYSNIKTYLQDHVYTPKENIYETNLYYFKNVIDEHRRNMVKGFKIKEKLFNELFDDYHDLVKKIIALSEEIVNQSAIYNWNAFCNYICNFPASLGNCDIYSLIYHIENKHFFDFQYECKGEKDFIDNFITKLKEFDDLKKNLNATIEQFYTQIDSISSSRIQLLLDSSHFTLYTKSISDGKAVSLILNQPMLCEVNTTTEITNERLNRTKFKNQTDKETIYKNPCGLFNCLDDFFMEFYDSHENNASHILTQFNYTKTKIIPVSNDPSFVYYYFEDEIGKLADDKLKFESSKFIYVNYLLLLFTLIYVLF